MPRRIITTLALVALAACEFPTEPPRWEQTWVLPVDRIQISVAELLPDSVEINADTSAFVIRTPASAVELSLLDLCGDACLLANGMTVPKPAFHDTIRTTTTLPAELVSAMLAGGEFDVSMAHDFDFDPLRPSADPAEPVGHIVVRIVSAGNRVAFDSISGDDQAFPRGSSLVPSLPIQAVMGNDTLAIEIEVYSPAGDSATIDVTDTLGVDFAPSTIEIASLTMNATGIAIDSVNTHMGFGVDPTTVERVQGGALRFDVRNPFTATGTLDLSIRGPFPTIDGSMPIVQGDYVERLDFTAEQLRGLLSADSVDVVVAGDVSADGGTLTVAPGDALVMDNQFEIVLLIGPDDVAGGGGAR